jgi:hypothetical protein
MPSEANVKKAATEFAGKITSCLTEFQRIVPSFSDPDLTNRFLEAQVRSLIEECLAPKRMLSGVFSVPGASSPTAAPSHIEGAVHDPERGQPTFEQGSFCVINPATCVGLIQIKPTVANVSKFEHRLREIAQTSFFGRRPGMVMGIVVSDVAPEKNLSFTDTVRLFLPTNSCMRGGAQFSCCSRAGMAGLNPLSRPSKPWSRTSTGWSEWPLHRLLLLHPDPGGIRLLSFHRCWWKSAHQGAGAKDLWRLCAPGELVFLGPASIRRVAHPGPDLV